MMKRAVLCLLFFVAAGTPWAVAQNGAGASGGDAANGKQLYMKDGCSYCHGTVGQGGGGRTGGLRLAQMPIPFGAFLNQLRYPANEMPPFVESVLSNREATDIYAYVKNLPPPPDAKSIPTLNDLGN